MGSVPVEASPYLRAQGNLATLRLDQMAASLPDYVRLVGEGEVDLIGRGGDDGRGGAGRGEAARAEGEVVGLPVRQDGARGLRLGVQPSVPRAKVEELATLRFVDRAENVLLVSPGASGRPTSR